MCDVPVAFVYVIICNRWQVRDFGENFALLQQNNDWNHVSGSKRDLICFRSKPLEWMQFTGGPNLGIRQTYKASSKKYKLEKGMGIAKQMSLKNREFVSQPGNPSSLTCRTIEVEKKTIQLSFLQQFMYHHNNWCIILQMTLLPIH